MEEVTKEEMLTLFDAVTDEIKTFGEKTPAICLAIRQLIEQYPDDDQEG